MQKPDPFESILKQQATQKGDDDDVVTISIEHNGRIIQIMERRHELKYQQDPDGSPIPYTTSETLYFLGDDGRSFTGTRNIGGCRKGCIVRIEALRICKHCKETVCRKHSFRTGSRTYCRSMPCVIWGRMFQVLRFCYLVIRFFILSIIGADTTRQEEPEQTMAPDEPPESRTNGPLH